MDFNDGATSLSKKIWELAPVIETEEAAKNAFIMPFISNVLGYENSEVVTGLKE